MYTEKVVISWKQRKIEMLLLQITIENDIWPIK